MNAESYECGVESLQWGYGMNRMKPDVGLSGIHSRLDIKHGNS